MVVVALTTASCQQDVSKKYTMPAEWQPHEAVWMGWFGRERRDTVSAQIIAAILDDVKVNLLYRHDSLRTKGNKILLRYGVDTTKVNWLLTDQYFYWTRDPGPIFVSNHKGQLKIVDFAWNNYGEVYVYENYQLGRRDTIESQTDLFAAEHLKIPTIKSSMVAEGGGLEVNGEGVLMSVEETALQRNPGKSLQEIEKEYLRVLGCKKMIWLKRSTVHDRLFRKQTIDNIFTGGANGHIDEIARFAAPDVILLASIDSVEKDKNPVSKIDFDILNESYSTLSKATNSNGETFKIIRLPSPDLNHFMTNVVVDSTFRLDSGWDLSDFQDGDTVRITSAVSYLNFFVTNKTVLIPKYWRPGLPMTEKKKDDDVKEIFTQLFTGRKIVQIYPVAINRGGGGIHCATQQQPVGKTME